MPRPGPRGHVPGTPAPLCVREAASPRQAWRWHPRLRLCVPRPATNATGTNHDDLAEQPWSSIFPMLSRLNVRLDSILAENCHLHRNRASFVSTACLIFVHKHHKNRHNCIVFDICLLVTHCRDGISNSYPAFLRMTLAQRLLAPPMQCEAGRRAKSSVGRLVRLSRLQKGTPCRRPLSNRR